MAASQVGLLEMSCYECNIDPILKSFWGCDGGAAESPIKEPVSDIEYNSCPFCFVPSCVHKFIRVEKWNNMQSQNYFVNCKTWHKESVRYTKYKTFFENSVYEAQLVKDRLDKNKNV